MPAQPDASGPERARAGRGSDGDNPMATNARARPVCAYSPELPSDAVPRLNRLKRYTATQVRATPASDARKVLPTSTWEITSVRITAATAVPRITASARA